MPIPRRSPLASPRRRRSSKAIVGAGALLALAFALFAAPPVHAGPADEAPLIVIDPGHGGPYSNANANGLREKTVNLQIARALRDRLRARGYRVVMTRTTDRAVEPGDIRTWNYNARTRTWHYRADRVRGLDDGIPEDDLQARVDVANRLGADLFISVHANGSLSRAARGFETFASRRDALGISLSRSVQRAVIARTGLRDRGAQLRDFYVCRWTDMPAILIEAGFITNRADAALLRIAAFRGRIADGVAEGVDAFLRARPYRRVMRRLGGATPEEHAAAVAAADFPSGAATAIVAHPDEWAALPGLASLAVALDAPILWATPAPGGAVATRPTVPTATAGALARLAPERIVLVGTHAMLRSFDVTGLASAASLDASAVVSIATTDGAALSAAIASSATVGPRGIVFVASATTPRAALAAAPVAATLRAPLLTAVDGTLTPGARSFVEANTSRIRRFVLIGTAEQVPAVIAGPTPWVRYSDATSAGLSLKLNTALFANRPAGSLTPVTADARFCPEFLASAARAARSGRPLLLTSGRVLPAFTRQWITNNRSAIAAFEVHDARRATPLLMDHMLRKADFL